MQTISIEKAKAEIDSVFEEAIQGDEVIITKNNSPVLKLSKFEQGQNKSVPGLAKGKIFVSDDFDEPLEEFKDYM
ncbi:MAG: type II toxin-antitoxin system Phd/YefM family antitoxin [Ignavibacteria bacterium]|nr:type II toxin-antitoxin system Phd/YefM family antitoxin [Ignavibacteria bacterium]